MISYLLKLWVKILAPIKNTFGFMVSCSKHESILTRAEGSEDQLIYNSRGKRYEWLTTAPAMTDDAPIPVTPTYRDFGEQAEIGIKFPFAQNANKGTILYPRMRKNFYWTRDIIILTSCSGCCCFLSPLVVLAFFPLLWPLFTASVEATTNIAEKITVHYLGLFVPTT